MNKFWKETVKLVLTGAMGGGLALTGQYFLERSKESYELRRRSREVAESIAHDLGHSMNERLQVMARYHESLDNTQRDSARWRVTYDSVTDKWLIDRPTYRFALCQYYGLVPARELDRIYELFGQTRAAERLLLKTTPHVYTARNSLHHELRDSIWSLQAQMTARLGSTYFLGNEPDASDCLKLVPKSS
jgi:hypothetical protein